MKKRNLIVQGLIAIVLVIVLGLACVPMEVRTKAGVLTAGAATAMYVNGVPHDVTAYTISGELYVSLRDAATLLSGTSGQFDIASDALGQEIRLLSAAAYTVHGGEMDVPASGPQTAVLVNERVLLDEVQVSLKKAYRIDGEVYCEPEAIGAALNISAAVWDGVIYVDSAAPFLRQLPQGGVRLKAEKESEHKVGSVNVKQHDMWFEGGEAYWIRRYTFEEDVPQMYISSFEVPGTSIEIRYFDKAKDRWVIMNEVGLMPFETLYIQTDLYSMVVGVPGVYEPTENRTLTIQRERERSVFIMENEAGTGYRIQFAFEQVKGLMGEIWAAHSTKPLLDLDNPETAAVFRLHNLEWKARWSMDGYYFPTPSTYNPSGENVFYCSPASYTATALVSNPSEPLSYMLGYVMLKTIVKNQNEMGYFPTGPESLWLSEDFGIEAGFYDTRFNSDLARGMLYAHYRYDDYAFLLYVRRYMEFFLQFAAENHYEVEGGGWLVEDYWAEDKQVPTHVSLNHQLAEINYLIRHYKATGDERCMTLLDTLIEGLRNTEEQWVLENGNLEYGLHYTGTFNEMRDYPYLTYNDLFELRTLLNTEFGREEPFVERLMATKKVWMDANGVTDYRK